MKSQTIVAERVEPGFETPYNLFRRKLAPDLCCAVPEDRPVPAFLDGDTWEHAGNGVPPGREVFRQTIASHHCGPILGRQVF